MTLNRERLFGIVWRLALMALPLQTRWMRPASLGFWPWEQGTVAVYGSWFALLAVVLVGWPLAKRRIEKKTMQRAFICLAALALSSALAIAFSDPSTRQSRALAMGQWWAQVLLLTAFGLTLWRAEIEGRLIALWAVLSLVPHAVFGWAQYANQASPESKWLGLAYHASKEPGTSVIEHGDFRVLRVYGGFPHPNIFGGWLALALPFVMDAVARVWDKRKVLAVAAVTSLFAVILVLTYSRSAWLAAFVGIVFVMTHIARGRRTAEINVQSVGIVCMCALAISGAIAMSQREHLFVRFEPSARLEAKSIDARRDGLMTGIDRFKAKPLFGSGENAILLDMNEGPKRPYVLGPLEPPHNAFLMALDEAGLVGLLALILLASFVWRAVSSKIPLAVIGVIALFDHYPWSTWSGQCLLMLCVLLACAPYTRKTEERSKA